jgi:Phytanoyl-CoA dioxygenase (PhyH)
MSSPIEIRPGVVPNVDQFLDPRSWIELNPTLGVVNAELIKNFSVLAVDDASAKTLENRLVREGYFHVPQIPWNLPLGDMAQAIVRLVDRGLVPPFCFIYDEFWFMFAKLNQLLGRFLGPDYAMLPDFWAWYVDPRVGQSGWKPHRDKNRHALFPDRRPKSLTVWLPLTDATTLNGCIYIVPAHLDPTYNTEQEDDWRFDHQDIRALPSPGGGLFMWTSAVIHWGSRSSPLAAGPRISLAFEFQRGDVPPMNQPLLRPMMFLDLRQRLTLICKQVLQYQHMYPLTPELQKFSEAVVARATVPAKS